MEDQLRQIAESEERRQLQGLELIPSENYVSPGVLEALSTLFTNKYSEGYPGRRYYGGQENTDAIEQIAIDRAKELFGCDHANVQALSGAPANLAVYLAWLEPGDTILAMDLTHGGHLTHGAPVTAAAKLFNFVRYGMSDTETGAIDYDHLRELALRHKPKMILAGYSSYPRELDYAKFSEIAREVNAVAVADIAHIAGLIAGKVLANPFDHGFQICTSTTHKTLRGPRGGLILSNGTVSDPIKAPEKTIRNLPTLIDRSVFPGLQGGPHMNVVLAKAVAFGEALRPEFEEYAKQVVANAKCLAKELMSRGCKLITNGTDNHLMVVNTDVSFGISGGEAQAVLDRVGLTVNKNAVPDDARPLYDPSGIRLGTPAATTRGMKETDMGFIADAIIHAIENRQVSGRLEKIAQDVKEYCSHFPLPGVKK